MEGDPTALYNLKGVSDSLPKWSDSNKILFRQRLTGQTNRMAVPGTGPWDRGVWRGHGTGVWNTGWRRWHLEQMDPVRAEGP